MGFERGRRGQVPLGTSGARGLGKLRGRGEEFLELGPTRSSAAGNRVNA